MCVKQFASQIVQFENDRTVSKVSLVSALKSGNGYELTWRCSSLPSMLASLLTYTVYPWFVHCKSALLQKQRWIINLSLLSGYTFPGCLLVFSDLIQNQNNIYVKANKTKSIQDNLIWWSTYNPLLISGVYYDMMFILVSVALAVSSFISTVSSKIDGTVISS